MDISEEADAYKLSAELPGMNEKEIEVAVTDGTLTLTGEKKQETEQKDKDYYLSEREYGSFKRSFALPDSIDADKISADFAKGVLTITLPKKHAAKAAPKKVEVKAAS
jgi:HSP20 family protein